MKTSYNKIKAIPTGQKISLYKDNINRIKLYVADVNIIYYKVNMINYINESVYHFLYVVQDYISL